MRPGIKPVSSWILVRFVSSEPRPELSESSFKHTNQISHSPVQDPAVVSQYVRMKPRTLHHAWPGSLARSAAHLADPLQPHHSPFSSWWSRRHGPRLLARTVSFHLPPGLAASQPLGLTLKGISERACPHLNASHHTLRPTLVWLPIYCSLLPGNHKLQGSRGCACCVHFCLPITEGITSAQ